jgi:hypothetical protein
LRRHGTDGIGAGDGRGREAIIVALGVLVTVLSSWLPSFQGWLIRTVAVVGVAFGLALTRRLDAGTGVGPVPRSRPAPTPPVSSTSRPVEPGSTPQPRRLVGVGPLAAAEQATGALFIGGHRRVGTVTVVAEGLAVTAATAIEGGGPMTVRFRGGPGGEESGCERAVAAERIQLGEAADRLGVAVVRLDGGVETPAPVGLWPTQCLPAEVIAVGDGNEAGDLGEGHDRGGPVCDPGTGLLVGVVVGRVVDGVGPAISEGGAEPGPRARMVPVGELRRVWDGLPRPWSMVGEGARAHFTQRAAGQRSVIRGGDLFRGRAEALRVVGEWTSAERCPGVPLVVTAQPGAGKSAVVARALLAAERAGHRDGVGFHARAATLGDFVDAVAGACGVDGPRSWKELAQHLAGRGSGDPLIVVVDALDEASGNDVAELRLALRDLARLDWVRVVVATRPLATGDPCRPGGHLYALGVTQGAASPNLVDLDSDRFFAAGDLRAYTATLLAQSGFGQPGPEGGAWETYRRDPDLCERLAGLVVDRAGRNYLVAGMSAFPLSEDARVRDPAAWGFDPTEIPSGVGEALSKYLERLPTRRRLRHLDLLSALAYGRGAGLGDQRWLAFTRALRRERVTHDDLEALRTSGAADYLLETGLDENGEPVTRLFHQALVDELLARRTPANDERRLVGALRHESPTGSWLDASAYARRHAPGHAAAAGTLELLLTEPEFLVGMAPAGMRSALPHIDTRSRADPAAVYDLALPFLGEHHDDRGANAALLAFVSHAQGNRALGGALAALDVERPWQITGSARAFDLARSRFVGHTDRVMGIAGLDWPGFNHRLVVSTSADGTARVWDPQRPEAEFARFDRHTGWVVAVAGLDWPGLDHPVVVTGSRDGTARVWDPQGPDRELARFEGHTASVTGVAGLDWPGLDHPVVVTGSRDGTARVWDPRSPQAELARFDGQAAPVAGIARVGRGGDPHPVVVTASVDGRARVWDPLRPEAQLPRFAGHVDRVWGVARLDWPGLEHPVVVTTSRDGTARVWDTGRLDVELACFAGHTDRVSGVAALDWPGPRPPRSRHHVDRRDSAGVGPPVSRGAADRSAPLGHGLRRRCARTRPSRRRHHPRRRRRQDQPMIRHELGGMHTWR